MTDSKTTAVFTDERLDTTDRNGWTPSEVRDLIAAFRVVRRERDELRGDRDELARKVLEHRGPCMHAVCAQSGR